MARQLSVSAARSVCIPARPRLCMASSAARLCPSSTSTVISLMLLAYAAAMLLMRHFQRWECAEGGEDPSLPLDLLRHFLWSLRRDTSSSLPRRRAYRKSHLDNK